MRKNILSCIGMASALCACGGDRPSADEETVHARVGHPRPAHSVAGKEGSSRRALELRRNQRPPPQYLRPVNVQIIGATFSTSGSQQENSIGSPSKDFSSSNNIFIAIKTKGSDGNYQISTRWSDPDDKLLLENGRVVAAAGATQTVFSLSQPSGWNFGTHTVEVMINGKTAGKYLFQVL